MFHPRCSALSGADPKLWTSGRRRLFAIVPPSGARLARTAIATIPHGRLCRCLRPAVAATHLQFAVRNRRGRVNMHCDVLRLSKHSEQGREFRARGSPQPADDRAQRTGESAERPPSAHEGLDPAGMHARLQMHVSGVYGRALGLRQSDERLAKRLRDRSRLPVADEAAVDDDGRHDLGGSARQEALVG